MRVAEKICYPHCVYEYNLMVSIRNNKKYYKGGVDYENANIGI